MLEIGKQNTMRVIKRLPFGAILIHDDDESAEEVLLPKRYEPENCQINDVLDVFVYLDSEDRIIATTEKPFAHVDGFGFLKVVDVNKNGAFFDWGLSKDLLVPYGEQIYPVKVGETHVVYLYLDDRTHRITGSNKIDKWLKEQTFYLKQGQQVELLIYAKTDLGFKAIVNNDYSGLLYDNEIFQPLKIGDKVTGFIKNIRPDNKIDLTLQLQPPEATRDELSSAILEDLKQQGGTSDLTDKSRPEAIYRQYGVSKKSYKKALGQLYKKRLIVIEKDRISLV